MSNLSRMVEISKVLNQNHLKFTITKTFGGRVGVLFEENSYLIKCDDEMENLPWDYSFFMSDKKTNTLYLQGNGNSPLKSLKGLPIQRISRLMVGGLGDIKDISSLSPYNRLDNMFIENCEVFSSLKGVYPKIKNMFLSKLPNFRTFDFIPEKRMETVVLRETNVSDISNIAAEKISVDFNYAPLNVSDNPICQYLIIKYSAFKNIEGFKNYKNTIEVIADETSRKFDDTSNPDVFMKFKDYLISKGLYLEM